MITNLQLRNQSEATDLVRLKQLSTTPEVVLLQGNHKICSYSCWVPSPLTIGPAGAPRARARSRPRSAVTSPTRTRRRRPASGATIKRQLGQLAGTGVETLAKQRVPTSNTMTGTSARTSAFGAACAALVTETWNATIATSRSESENAKISAGSAEKNSACTEMETHYERGWCRSFGYQRQKSSKWHSARMLRILLMLMMIPRLFPASLTPLIPPCRSPRRARRRRLAHF